MLGQAIEAPVGGKGRQLKPDACEEVRRAADTCEPLWAKEPKGLEARTERLKHEDGAPVGAEEGSERVVDGLGGGGGDGGVVDGKG